MTISANLFVATDPSVLAAGGSALDLIAVVLTKSTRVPIGAVMSFPDGEAVTNYFGGGSKEDQIANGGAGFGSGYFGGFDTSTVKPAAILFTQYPAVAVSAYLRGGNISAIALTTLQGYSGTLTVTIDGVVKSASVNLSAATSFTNAAQLASVDLAIDGAQDGAFSATIAATVMTVPSAPSSGKISVGDRINGAGVTAGSFVSSFGTGTGGAGTYNLTQSSTVGSSTSMTALLPGISYDSVSGAFVITSGTTGAASTVSFASGAMATDLLLTQALGAVMSIGAIAAVPGTFMDAVKKTTQNWATFMTAFDPDNGSGFTQKLAFSAWANSQNNRFAYSAWDTNASPTVSVPATASFGYAVTQANYSGTILNWEPSDTNIAAMICGFIASVNFAAEGGRIDFAFKAQSGMVPGVTDDETAVNLGGNPQVTGDRGNGYNYYGAIATANALFTNYQTGMITGPYLWIDSFIDQIWLNNNCQLALMEYFQQANSTPFNTAGQGSIEGVLNGPGGPIENAISFGAIASGITLSPNQIAVINAAAGGKNIANTISTQGWYLLFTTASPTVRQGRGPQQLILFYTDGESVHAINLGTVTIL